MTGPRTVATQRFRPALSDALFEAEAKVRRPCETKGSTPTGPLLTAALALLLAVPAPTAARAEVLRLGYQVAWGHLTLAEAEVSYSQSEDRYRLAGSGRTEGLLALFVSWRGRAETEGLLEAQRRIPLLHRNEGIWEEKTRRTRVAWEGAALPKTEATPPPDLDEVTPVPAAATRGTSDPFTVALTVLDRVTAGGRCEAEAKVWDGRRRYDLKVIHLGEEMLVADRPWAYEGPAIACTLEHEPIGGFWREPPGWRATDPEGTEAPARSRKLWAAEIAPGRWALVRAELETAYGTVVARLLPEGGLGGTAAAAGDAPLTE